MTQVARTRKQLAGNQSVRDTPAIQHAVWLQTVAHPGERQPRISTHSSHGTAGVVSNMPTTCLALPNRHQTDGLITAAGTPRSV